MKIIYNINKKVLLQEAEQKPSTWDRAFNTTIGTLAGAEGTAEIIAQHNTDALRKKIEKFDKAEEAFKAEHPDNSPTIIKSTLPEVTPDMQNQALMDAKDDVVARWKHFGNSLSTGNAGTSGITGPNYNPEDFNKFQQELTSEKLNNIVQNSKQFSLEKNPDYVEPPSFDSIPSDHMDPNLAIGAIGAGALAGGTALYKATPAIERGIDKIVNYIRK